MDEFPAVSKLSCVHAYYARDVAVRSKKEYFDRGNPPSLEGELPGIIFPQPHSKLNATKSILARLFGAA